MRARNFRRQVPAMVGNGAAPDPEYVEACRLDRCVDVDRHRHVECAAVFVAGVVTA
jgi:hypothetical protein